MTDYKGIDYGRGQVNLDPITGIRFGVLPSHMVADAWHDTSEPEYPDVRCDACKTLDSDDPGQWCDDCQQEDELAEPIAWGVDASGVVATSDSIGDIFVTRSPFYTYAQFCSPCAPGACYLPNHLDTRDAGNRAYCLGHDWFENGQAPYPVFSVATGREIKNIDTDSHNEPMKGTP